MNKDTAAMAGILMTLVEYSYISESVQARGTLVFSAAVRTVAGLRLQSL